ncbi:SAM-dependent methyltransferase [Amycolatopsis minnesotensis]|uniref:SAM-dependent methyltransferase n=1 Tax=Amycolatopsis minnesotensis TaxID=337894 RepID=A0ABN2SAN3_9PSEU
MPEPADRAPTQLSDSEVDLTKPSAARMYDWYLGGTSNWAVDRLFGKKAEETWPQVKATALHNRQFLRRVVQAALAAGIRQFLDLGTGVPTVGNIHDVIREHHLDPDDEARVLYVDYEPVAAAHGRRVLADDDVTDWGGLAQRDMRDPAAVFGDSERIRLLRMNQPVCVLFIAVLHFVGDGDHPMRLLDEYRRRVVPGSWIAISHASNDAAPPEGAANIQKVVDSYQKTSNPMWLRDRAAITSWLDVEGWELLKPGVVHPPDWRPKPGTKLNAKQEDARPYMWSGVASKN